MNSSPSPTSARSASVTIVVSVVMHVCVAYGLGALGSEPAARAAQPPTMLGFQVLEPLPEPEVVQPEVAQPTPRRVARRPRKALRRAASPVPEPRPEARDDQLGESDAEPAREPLVAMEQPALSTADGVAVSVGAGAEQGRSSSTGDDLVNRSGSARGEGAAPVIDLRALAQAWKQLVNGVLRREVRSHYPVGARRLRQQGVVWVQFRVSGSGHIDAVQLRRSSGHGRLDRAALALLEDLSTLPEPPHALRPHLRKAPLTVPIHFRLD